MKIRKRFDEADTDIRAIRIHLHNSIPGNSHVTCIIDINCFFIQREYATPILIHKGIISFEIDAYVLLYSEF